jgi:hypothetical protein
MHDRCADALQLGNCMIRPASFSCGFASPVPYRCGFRSACRRSRCGRLCSLCSSSPKWSAPQHRWRPGESQPQAGRVSPAVDRSPGRARLLDPRWRPVEHRLAKDAYGHGRAVSVPSCCLSGAVVA